MNQPERNSLTRTIDGYTLDVFADAPDFRDYEYRPPLIKIPSSYPVNRKLLTIMNQGEDGSCTGFALGACINHLNRQRKKSYRVSNRMLYNMARRFDEWPGNDYAGSSCRGVIKGWYAMGACRENLWSDDDTAQTHLTVNAAKAARENRVGAYYRLKHQLSDFHAAVNETGAVLVSANVHTGWESDAVSENQNAIRFREEPGLLPGHAFAIVGYNDNGFVVQNSWGQEWGDRGLAVWSYEDWYHNLRDAWAFRLSLSSKAIWQISTLNRNSRSEVANPSGTSRVIRSEIAGHFVHIDDGRFHDHGSYWSNLPDVEETAALIADKREKYRHLMLFAHGGLVNPAAEAARIRAYKPVLKANGIYPYHFMYDTGLFEEIKDLILRGGEQSKDRVGGLAEFTDVLIEKLVRRPGRSIWREMKSGACAPFDPGSAGWQTLAAFAEQLMLVDKPIKLHCVAHSTGGILVAYLLQALESIAPSVRIHSVSLMAPACTETLFRSHYLPLLKEKKFFGIRKMHVYNLNRELELDDNVAAVYRKSLLYLVSRAFEEDTPAALLGLQDFSSPLDRSVGKLVDFHYSDGQTRRGQKTTARSHGGFDNDPVTMNHIVRTILGNAPSRPFTASDLGVH
ncbi:MAG: C1 family peptidase [Pseudomonadota bacterium]